MAAVTSLGARRGAGAAAGCPEPSFIGPRAWRPAVR